MTNETVELIYMMNDALKMVPKMLDIGRNWGVIDGMIGSGKIPQISDVFPAIPFMCQQMMKRRMAFLREKEGLPVIMGKLFSCFFVGVSAVLIWQKRPSKRDTLQFFNEMVSMYPIENFDNSVMTAIDCGSEKHAEMNAMLLGIISTSKDMVEKNPNKFESLMKAEGVAVGWYGMSYAIHKLGIKALNC